MKKRYLKGFGISLLTVLFMLNGLESHGQNAAEKKNSHSLYGGAGFTSNMVYMGTSISQDKPVFSGSLTYGFKDKLYLSTSSFHLSAFDPFMAFHTISLNYSQTVNSWFDFSAGVTRYQVAPSLADTLFRSFVYGSATLGFDWKILYTKVSLGAVLSDETSAYLQLGNSRYLQTPQLLDGKAYVSFDPYINMLFGTLTRTKTSEGTTIGISQPFSSKKSEKNTSQSSTTFFGLTEIDMGIPVAFNMDRFTIEAEPGYIIPMYSDTELFNPEGFVFMVNCYVKIF
jgi:hypothetical protein